MRTVRANRKLELEQKLVCRRAIRICGSAILAPHLTEFARPVRDDCRLAGVEKRRIVGMVGAIVPGSSEPPTRKLIISRDVVTHTVLPPIRLIATAPDDLASTYERSINRAP